MPYLSAAYKNLVGASLAISNLSGRGEVLATARLKLPCGASDKIINFSVIGSPRVASKLTAGLVQKKKKKGSDGWLKWRIRVGSAIHWD